MRRYKRDGEDQIGVTKGILQKFHGESGQRINVELHAFRNVYFVIARNLSQLQGFQ